VSLKKQFLALQPKLAKVDLALPKVKKQSEVALQLQQLANGSGMTISAISFSGGASGQSLPSATSQTIAVGNATALPITFQLTGTYEQLQTFLQKLEQLNRYTNVSSLSISRTTSNKLTFSLTVNAFIKP
jgi:Tfp pilus assembly protein PilO